MCYGHFNFNGLRTLQQRNMVGGLPQFNVTIKVCQNCVVGKQYRESFPVEKAWMPKKLLQLIHSDLCDPINPASKTNKRYFISLTDDDSIKTWVQFLQQKKYFFSAFKVFAQKESRKKMKVLRTDRGGEFKSNEFTSFGAMKGIRRQLTTTYTPQNGVSERKNCIILNMVRCMLAGCKINSRVYS